MFVLIDGTGSSWRVNCFEFPICSIVIVQWSSQSSLFLTGVRKETHEKTGNAMFLFSKASAVWVLLNCFICWLPDICWKDLWSSVTKLLVDCYCAFRGSNHWPNVNFMTLVPLSILGWWLMMWFMVGSWAPRPSGPHLLPALNAAGRWRLSLYYNTVRLQLTSGPRTVSQNSSATVWGNLEYLDLAHWCSPALGLGLPGDLHHGGTAVFRFLIQWQIVTSDFTPLTIGVDTKVLFGSVIALPHDDSWACSITTSALTCSP